eukprot:TRINITY_DN12253_c0_g1_i1.p1 TRINITY_DN12253_c0_g1~~TRINITY_DN12253_c0_g1_i1.p1  ORF type:complete len:343 (+),score=95.06 TRINITY_DN12253_c0_g1_i1:78-1106(+)
MPDQQHITIDTAAKQPPLTHTHHHTPDSLPPPKTTHTVPSGAPGSSGKENARLYFVGTATTILEWEGLRMMTDPNFLHEGDHVHLGPGVVGTRVTNPAINLEDLPPVDFVLLSHYHADHFDQKVEAELRKNLPIITTPHAQDCLSAPDKGFSQVYAVDVWQKMFIDLKTDIATKPRITVSGMPGKHVAGPVIETLNDFVGAVPPTNGWMLELGYAHPTSSASKDEFKVGYTIYISGDTLFVEDLKAIPEKYPHVDLMLVHLGGTTIPGPHLPLLMVTMDAEMGMKLVRLIHPDVTIPIHYDDYDVFVSKLSDFKEKMHDSEYKDKAVYLDRGDEYKFEVRQL